MQWDFWTLNPESTHQVTYLMGDRGIPKTWRHLNGYGSHTYMWINEAGEKCWVKYHFISNQGVEGLTGAEANRTAGEDADNHRRDLHEAIERNGFPSWTLSAQVMPYADARDYRFNPFDLTKIWPHSDYPLIKVATMTLNNNPEDFFAQIEQAAFSPGNTVPGIGFSPDKMLLGRTFAYADAPPQPDRHQLPPAAGQPPARAGERLHVRRLDDLRAHRRPGGVGAELGRWPVLRPDRSGG
jgi:catalase